MKWLLLIHQIPTAPNALRVKIWRRLQQTGAVAVKQSVYALPFGEHTREDFGWILKEIIAGGGDGSICEACFVEGLTDTQIIDLFHAARRADYEKFIEEANQILWQWSHGQSDPADPAVRAGAQLAKLRKRLDEIGSIDFFQAPRRAQAASLMKELEALIAGRGAAVAAAAKGMAHLKGKTWVTRQNIFVDRIACGWLIRRFVDQEAVFKYVSGPEYHSKPGEIGFDMFDGQYTHEGDRCTFEVMIQRLGLGDHALVPMAEVIHDIDLKDGKYARNETGGLQALLTGLVAEHPSDDQRMEIGRQLFDNLYAYFGANK